MRRLILTTVSAIALAGGLTFAGTQPASAWAHSSMRSHTTHVSRAEVRDIQQKLQADNLYHGKVDGMMGRETRRALADYQRQNGLRVTANLDRQTRDSLLGATGTTTPPASPAGMAPAPSQRGAATPAPNQSGASTPASPSGGTRATGK
jgi:peptidoglycan hydrolase-like protein with peptidoglycan-binding domain